MFKSSLIYLASSLFNKAAPFLLLPILTKYLTPSEYGLIAIFQLLFTLYLSLFGSLQINIPRTYFSLEKERFPSYMKSVFVVLLLALVLTLFLSLLYIVLGGPTFGFDGSWFLALPVIAALGMVNLLNLTLLRTQEKPLTFAGWEISHAVVNLLLSILFITVLIMGWQGRVLGIVVPVVLFGLFGLMAIYKQGLLSHPYKIRDVKETISVSAPLIPHAIAAVMITSIDRVFIEQMLGGHAVGIYSVGYQFGMVVMLFTDAFLKAWQPWFFKKLNEENRDEGVIIKYTYYYLAALVVGACLYGLLAKNILPYLVGEQFLTAVDIIIPVCISYIFYGMYQIFLPYLVVARKTKFLVFITPLAAVVNIVFNFILIPIYGMVGAAYATIIAYIASSVIVFYFSNKFYPMPWLIVSRS